jgi:predicted nucleotidyltransferase
MKELSRHFTGLFECLNSAQVRFLILGGYAVNFHGHHRNTKDIDVWIAVDPQNAQRVSRALQMFGFAAESVPPELFLSKGIVYAFGREPTRVDILTDPHGIDFDACYKRRVEVQVEGIPVPFISVEDLIVNKTASGRLRDLADVSELRMTIENRQPALPSEPGPKVEPDTDDC